MGKNKQRKQSGASNHSDSDGNTCSSHENSLLSSFDPNGIPSLSQPPPLAIGLTQSSGSAIQCNLDLPPHSSHGVVGAQPICNTSSNVLPMMPNITTKTNSGIHKNHNFEGFLSSLPLDDVSDSDTVITAGQRNNVENLTSLKSAKLCHFDRANFTPGWWRLSICIWSS